MHLAAERGHTGTVEFLADKFKASVFDRTKDGSTLMHIAALNGHPDTAMVLFKKGVPLLMPNRVGEQFSGSFPRGLSALEHILQMVDKQIFVSGVCLQLPVATCHGLPICTRELKRKNTPVETVRFCFPP